MTDRGRGRRGRPTRLRREQAVAAAAATALFVLLFLPWYDATIVGSSLSLPDPASGDRTAWETLGLIAPLLGLVAVASLCLVLMSLWRPGRRPAITAGAALVVLGGFGVVLVGFRLLVPPGLDGPVGVELEASPGLAAFLALVAGLCLVVGGYRVMRAEGSSFAAVADALQPPRGRPASRKR